MAKADFNSYGARRGNHEAMMRGTFFTTCDQNQSSAPRVDGTRVEGGSTQFLCLR